LLRLSAATTESAVAIAERLELQRDPDELAFERDLVKALITRRLSGRFALEGADTLGLTNDTTEHLAASLLRELRAQALLDIKTKR
jgi:hypothetical protein